MQTNAKIQARAGHQPVVLTPPQWEAIATAFVALRAAFQPALQPLSEAERRQLLRVRIANEAFTADYIALLQAHPGAVPSLLRPADTVRDWQTREQLLAHQALLAQLSQDVADTLAGLSGDCYASALAAYRMLARDGAPAGMQAIVAPLREHVAQREERKRRTRALKAAANEADSPANVTALPAAAAAPRAGLVPTSLAA